MTLAERVWQHHPFAALVCGPAYRLLTRAAPIGAATVRERYAATEQYHTVGDRAESLPGLLGALIAQAGVESVREVRVGGKAVAL